MSFFRKAHARHKLEITTGGLVYKIDGKNVLGRLWFFEHFNLLKRTTGHVIKGWFKLNLPKGEAVIHFGENGDVTKGPKEWIGENIFNILAPSNIDQEYTAWWRKVLKGKIEVDWCPGGQDEVPKYDEGETMCQ